jgi:hypothetical protein
MFDMCNVGSFPGHETHADYAYRMIKGNPHHNVFDVVLLEDKRSEGKQVCVSTCHLFWSDSTRAREHHFQQIFQMQLLSERVASFLGSMSVPVVIAGDFNASPSNAACVLLRDGCVRLDHPDADITEADLKQSPIARLGLGGMKFHSAYPLALGAELPYTVVTDLLHTIDHIWFSNPEPPDSSATFGAWLRLAGVASVYPQCVYQEFGSSNFCLLLNINYYKLRIFY